MADDNEDVQYEIGPRELRAVATIREHTAMLLLALCDEDMDRAIRELARVRLNDREPLNNARIDHAVRVLFGADRKTRDS